jgi:hypothetical protein
VTSAFNQTATKPPSTAIAALSRAARTEASIRLVACPDAIKNIAEPKKSKEWSDAVQIFRADFQHVRVLGIA